MYEKVLSILKKAQNENSYLKKNYQQKSSRNQSYENAKICYIYKEKFKNKYLKDKKLRKVTDHCHYTGKCRGAAHSTCNLKNSVANIPIVFHNGSNYDNHFIIKEWAEELKKLFTCLLENTEEYITFPITFYSSNRKTGYKN